jgi:hypothetical protein
MPATCSRPISLKVVAISSNTIPALPALVFADWFALSSRQSDLLWHTAQKFVKAWEAFDVETVGRTSEILYALAKELITQRRAMPLDPEEDPVSSLLQARDGKGAPLPADMLVGCVQILVVGLVRRPCFWAASQFTLRVIHRSRPNCVPSPIDRSSLRGISAALHTLSRFAHQRERRDLQRHRHWA